MAAMASSYNYFSSNTLNFSGGGGDAPGTDGDEGIGQEERDGASVHDMYFDEDENLGYIEKIYLFARSKAVFHRYVLDPAISPRTARSTASDKSRDDCQLIGFTRSGCSLPVHCQSTYPMCPRLTQWNMFSHSSMD